MVLETIGLIFAFLAAVSIAAFVAYGFGVEHERRKPAPVVPADLYDELTQLRHLKAQLDTPPQHHEHIWPREPDQRKLGWLRYRCAYGGCPQVKWEPS